MERSEAVGGREPRGAGVLKVNSVILLSLVLLLVAWVYERGVPTEIEFLLDLCGPIPALS